MAVNQSPVAQKCARHNQFPDYQVCKQCLLENEARRLALEEALKSAPHLIDNLFKEGRAYLGTLLNLQEALSPVQGHGIGDQNALRTIKDWVDEALKDHKTRILSQRANTPVMVGAKEEKPSSFKSKLILPRGFKN